MGHYLVGGIARSGTTLLYGAMCSGTQTNPALFESHLVPSLLAAYRETLRRLESIDEGQFFHDAAAVRTYFAMVILDFLELVRIRHGSPLHLVVKSIALTPHCLQALEVLADCKLVISIRDPRDIVASQLDVAVKDRAISAGQHTGADIQRLSKQIMSSYESSLKLAPDGNDRLRFVRYEDLVASPRDVVGQLAAWSGLDLSEFNPNNAWARSLRNFDADRAAGSSYVTELFGKGVSDQRTGRFRQRLRTADIRLIEAICEPIMSAFRYQPFSQ